MSSCTENDKQFDAKKCLSCNFYLAKKTESVFAVLFQHAGSEKYEIVIDTVKKISWRNCYIISELRDKFLLINFDKGKINKHLFPSQDSLEKHLLRNNASFSIRLSSAESIYNMLLPLAVCE